MSESCGSSSSKSMTLEKQLKLANLRIQKLTIERDTAVKMVNLQRSADDRLTSIELEVKSLNSCGSHESADKMEYVASYVSSLPRVNVDQDTVIKQSTLKVNCDPHKETAYPVSNDILKTAQLLRTCMGMPTSQPLKFSGDPKEYFGFIRHFQSSIARFTDDNSTLLSQLISCCSGDAVDAIKRCTVLDPRKGYDEALKILERRFGQPHVIARNCIDELVDGPPLRANDHQALTKLTDSMRLCSETLKQLNYESDLNACRTLRSIVQRLPGNLQTKWFDVVSTILKCKREPTFNELTEFISDKADAAAARLMYTSSPILELPVLRQTIKSQKSVTSIMTTSKLPSQPMNCSCCEGSHYLDQCQIFLKLSVEDRRTHVKQHGLCFLCLKRNHRARTCRSRKSCGLNHCDAKHHPNLHLSTIQAATQSNDEDDGVPFVNHHSIESVRPVVFAVIPVRVRGPKGEKIVNAFLDNGSDTTLVKASLPYELGIECTPTSTTLRTITGNQHLNTKVAALELRPLGSEDIVEVREALVVKNLPRVNRVLPSVDKLRTWSHLRQVTLDHIPDPTISILIGCDVPKAHWVLEQRIGGPDDPYATRGPLGWTLLGPTTSQPRGDKFRRVNHLRSGDITGILEGMFNFEFVEATVVKRCPSREDRATLDFLKSSLLKVGCHYQLPLPWKSGAPNLPDNRFVAQRRLMLLKRRFAKDESFRRLYSKTVEEYISKGYAEKVPLTQHYKNGPDVWYLPHHGVFKNENLDKVRVVFDCAAECNGISLNRQLYSGPDLANNLTGVLLRFRQFAYVFVGDIEAMFHQIKLHPDDRDALRFLWWDEGDIQKPIQTYRMTVHTFGATSSPCCANLALQEAIQTSDEFCDNDYGNKALRSFYVDDCLLSLADPASLYMVVKRLRRALRNAGFNLTKCSSNNHHVMESIHESDRVKHGYTLDRHPAGTQRTLGIEWNAENDSFVYKIIPWEGELTRRSLLSYIASLFDPMGLVSPVLLPAKCLLQDLCRRKANWDDAVTLEEKTIWLQWLTQFNAVRDLNVPRCLITTEANPVRCELHGFSDASNIGYGAVLYLRVIDSNNQRYCKLLLGKSRVAPTKAVTIPRLELVAAVLLSRMTAFTKGELTIDVHSTSLWTDSMVVLQLIRNTSSRYETFVANRLAVIHDFSSQADWKHIEGKHNPADLASRGMDIRKASSERWFRGPDFLWNDECQWPAQPETLDIPNEFIQRERVTHNITTVSCEFWLNAYSRVRSWPVLLRRVAWIYRFCRWIENKHRCVDSQFPNLLTLDEIRVSEHHVLRSVQSVSFREEYSSATRSNGSSISFKASNLVKLKPIMHEDLLRVGGRIDWAPIPFESKHPVILPSNHFVTTLLIQWYHEKNGHAGTLHILSALRERYWIIKGQSSVRRVLTNCMYCKLRHAKPITQVMAPLPEDRMRLDEPAFSIVGIDYFGPFSVKRGRGVEKRYGCLFTCLTMRAIHLEVSYSLDTDSFLCTFTRFVARRGCPRRIYSDNGTNFRGAESELRTCLDAWDQQRIANHMLERRCDWMFSPPRASHRGGVWERMIRSVRRVLGALLREQLVNDEVLLTAFAEVEKIINERPLTKLSDNPEDSAALTPNMLLLLRANPSTTPNGGETCVRQSLTRRWRQSLQLAEIFWKRWLKEYLPSLQERQKWCREYRDLRVGDLVLLTDKGAPKGLWLKGVIQDTVKGEDGHVREASVKTKNGIVRRDIRNICILEETNLVPSADDSGEV